VQVNETTCVGGMEPLPANPQRLGWIETALVPSACYVLSTAVVLLGIAFGRGLLRSSPLSPDAPPPPTFLSSLTLWDGGWYARIAEQGYSFNPAGESTFAFFPAYPLLARAVRWATRIDIHLALVATSHLCLLAALIVLYRYARERTRPDDEAPQIAVASAVLIPTTFFFRVAYAESLLFLLVTLVLYGIERRWAVPWLALLVGLATAVRPSGVALLLPLGFVLLARPGKGWLRISNLAWLALGCWGIAAFMAFAAVKFGDPIAFVHAQAKWHVRPHVPLHEKIVAVFTLGAVRGVFSPHSPFYWRHYLAMTPPAFNLYLANSIYFAGTIAAIAYGAAKGWLNRYEVAVGAALVGIPYLAHNYETTMMAVGRYMTTVVPTYLVVGRLLRRAPVAITIGLAAVSAFMLGAYSALFGMGYWLI
jgi:Mannosyltransferase (PIG-V)